MARRHVRADTQCSSALIIRRFILRDLKAFSSLLWMLLRGACPDTKEKSHARHVKEHSSK
jgi:hypothetical protein